jgi:hypothetical protein
MRLMQNDSNFRLTVNSILTFSDILVVEEGGCGLDVLVLVPLLLVLSIPGREDRSKKQ